ncbi:MAG TPA: alpha-amylase family glycosyl hydrolase, partial [Chitinophagaceae bacterium]|nr:alpha-amylase family glycosyl hydrolase [Chitinophagaceae bacterium]
YGPANSLKELIDSCHSNGISVVLDIVLNHSYGNSPMVKMYFDPANNRPAANNPWFNTVAPHSAIAFGYDFNHESDATKYFVNRVLEYWQKEFRIDGFRFDFTKGFTQKVTTTDAAMSAYDASRVAILKRINDSLQSHSPGSYMIIEHLADVTEERDLVLAGMLPWGNLNYNFNEATMGWVGTSNFDWAIHEKRGFAEPLLISYMESHDEERLMYKNLKYGNATSNYNIKDTLVGLRRNEMAAAFYFAIPGPKMVWQFGEVGYDISRCYLSTNGEGGDCDKKLDPKPIHWEYQNYVPRKRLFEVYSALMKLRKNYPNPFTSGSLSYNLSGAFKVLQVSHADMSITVIGNFDVNAATASVTLQNAGTWYNYLTGEPFTASGGSQSITLAPGEYKFLVNKNVVNAVVTDIGDIRNNNDQFNLTVYPNPVGSSSNISFSLPSLSAVSFSISDLEGRKIAERSLGVKPAGTYKLSLDQTFSSASPFSRGTYFITLQAGSIRSSKKIVY